ncbi:MAG: Na+/H+ antiporter subunit E [Pseudomonadota bacterium]
MSTILVNVLLALAWTSVTGAFTALNFAFGFVLSGIALLLIRGQLDTFNHFRKLYRSIALAVVFVVELVKSSVSVAMIVLSPGRKLQPAIIAYPLTVKSDAEITLLANMITLTPGTLSMDVSDDRSTLYVHAIDAPDIEQVITDIKSSFEERIMRVFS